METPHRLVHESVQAALSESDQDWEHDEQLQQSLIGHIHAAEEASTEVMHLLDEMVEETFRNRSR